MKVGIPKETGPGETRVAVIPAGVATLTKAGLQVAVEQAQALAAGFTDEAYRAQGATIVSRADALGFGHPPAGPRHAGRPGLPAGQTVIGFADPLGAPQAIRDVAATGAIDALDGADAAHHARAEHGRALVDGDDRRLQGRAAGRQPRCRACSRC